MSELALLGRDALPAIAMLCERAVAQPPTIDELEATLFTPDQPAVVRGDPSVGVVATATCDDGAHVRFLAVDPRARGRGHGHALAEAAEQDARAAGHTTILTGADPPFFLWPGIPSTELGLVCLFEHRHYSRHETNFDMRVQLDAIPDDPGGHALATADDRDEIDAWTTKHWSNWRAEALRALDKGNLVLVRGDDGIHAICAFEVNRTGFLGPVAARPDLMGKGRARPALLGALHELRGRGRTYTDVCWVGPVVPYAAVGGQVSNVYFVYRRDLR
ncbi:MAG TPA: GNAT family N-acetyltransferase [Acidimicrobiales bacterium]|nr:GNAT family N-acetyltransferase [Acidimicrobiales bacterium]